MGKQRATKSSRNTVLAELGQLPGHIGGFFFMPGSAIFRAKVHDKLPNRFCPRSKASRPLAPFL
jgi:hypothetical protein